MERSAAIIFNNANCHTASRKGDERRGTDPCAVADPGIGQDRLAQGTAPENRHKLHFSIAHPQQFTPGNEL